MEVEVVGHQVGVVEGVGLVDHLEQGAEGGEGELHSLAQVVGVVGGAGGAGPEGAGGADSNSVILAFNSSTVQMHQNKTMNTDHES